MLKCFNWTRVLSNVISKKSRADFTGKEIFWFQYFERRLSSSGYYSFFLQYPNEERLYFYFDCFFFQSETPQNLSAIALSWNTVKVTWTPLDEKEEVTSYDVEYCSVIGCRIVPVFDSSVVIDNLTQHTTYTVKTRGRNTKYTGPWRIASGVKTLGTRNRMTYASYLV